MGSEGVAEKVNRLESIAILEYDVIDRIVNDDYIALALSSNDRDFMNLDFLTEDQKEDLVFKSVYPYDFIPYNTDLGSENQPPLSQTKRSFITVVFTDYRPAGSNSFKANAIRINIFTHQDIERINSPTMTRTKFIASRIDHLFNQKRLKGAPWELNFESLNASRVSEVYAGYTFVFRLRDWN